MLVFGILTFYIAADHRFSKLAVGQASVWVIGFHVANIYFVLNGKVDQYTLMIMVHQALLLNGPQVIHLFKFQRRSRHRLFFITNTTFALAEFFLSWLYPNWTNREGNFCSKLSNAIEAAQRERITSTVILLVANVGLTLADVFIATSDRLRNKDTKSGEHSRHTVSRFVTWDKAVWSRRRIVYIAIGLVFFSFSIYNLEINIIRYFHKAVEHVDGISSVENSWSYYGQLLGGIAPMVCFLFSLRSYGIKVTSPFAKRTKGMLCYVLSNWHSEMKLHKETIANEHERKSCAKWTWVYYTLTPIAPRRPRGKARKNRTEASVQTGHQEEGSATPDVVLNSGTVSRPNNVYANPIQRVNNLLRSGLFSSYFLSC